MISIHKGGQGINVISVFFHLILHCFSLDYRIEGSIQSWGHLQSPKTIFLSKITHFGNAIYLYSACMVLAIEKLDFGNPNNL